ncbi:hypothetical protein [Salinispora tropica]|uniref:Uncharacterized protein n=1 Tax=Salinispora tropica (strain ATCC BAA-916 / DSM 44818 / JCM 13857 / NBRC 105044 / CNB-440) TaxID=369723 RepID=A4XBS2_SALTO|nr:hypothetical protein [Salinispora tropica]ABP56379.1 hypothetical protein Strop_3949 [Salinispora tropica CNB-440]
MTLDQDMMAETPRRPAPPVSAGTMVAYVAAGVLLFGWFLFGLLVQRQGLVDSVGETAGTAFGLLLVVAVVGTFRRDRR